ncbi:MAG: GTP-binding protein [Planctomycetota bacterium]
MTTAHAPSPPAQTSRGTELLRLLTCGSVDDGKSTLIGRLLYDTKTVFEDQLEAAERASLTRGNDRIDLALLTDGLRAEREQGITIDVAYRYFATPRRKFIIADCPGHTQYTRNMVTGASSAQLALILVDARHGVSEQTRRHAFIASLLRIPHMVLCVNKMDLVDYDQVRFEEICDEFRAFAARLEISDVSFIPVSALHGDNLASRSVKTPWYEGQSLLHHLEHVYIGSDRELIDCRFPVQWVVRPQSDEHPDYRGYAGTVASGVFKPGDEVIALPSGMPSRIVSIDDPGAGGSIAKLDAAFPPLSVVIRLEDDIDIARGDMLCRPNNRAEARQDIESMIVWLTEEPLAPRRKYAIQHTTSTCRALVEDLRYRVNITDLRRDQSAEGLGLNEIGRVALRTTKPLLCDPYKRCRATGSFILIDEATNRTAGAGMII